MGKLSNKGEKLALAWGKNILTKLSNGFSDGQSMGSYLNKYASENPEILSAALDLTFNIPSKKDEFILHEIAVIKSLEEKDENISHAAIESIECFLKYCEQPIVYGKKALVLLYEYLWAHHVGRVSIPQQDFEALLKPFLAYSALWDVISLRGDTIAHIAIQQGDIELLRKSLNHRPDWIETKNTNFEETLLYTATRHSKEDIAQILINDYKADINAINGARLNVLSNAINFNLKRTINILLDAGCSINPFSNLVLNPKSLSNVPELIKCGYFLPSVHRESLNATLISNHYNIPIQTFRNPFFYLVSRDNPSDYALITSPEDLRSSTITPTDQQIKRLHMSFDESLPYEIDEELRNLYELFKTIFPCKDNFITERKHPILDIGQHTLKEFSMRRIISESMVQPTNSTFIKMMDKILGEISTKESIKMLSPQEHQRTLHEFLDICMLSNKLNLVAPEYKEFQDLIYKTAYKYSTKIIPLIIEFSTREFILEHESHIINIFCISANHAVQNKEKQESKVVNALNLLIQLLKKKNITNLFISHLSIIRDIINSHLYVSNEFYEEFLAGIKSIIEHRVNLNGAANQIMIDSNIIFGLGLCLNKLVANPSQIVTQINTLRTITHYLLKYCNGIEHISQSLHDTLERKRNSLLDIYFHKIYSLASEVFKYKYSKDSESLYITFHDEYDQEKIRKIMKESIYFKRTVCANTQVFNLNHYGMSIEDLDTAISFMNGITEKSVTLEPESGQDSGKMSNTHTSECTTSYHLPLLSTSTKSTLRFSTRHLKLCDDYNTSSSLSLKISTQPDLNAIKECILKKLMLDPDTQIYLMNHPRYPESRQHLCWGIWLSSSMKNRPDGITDEVLQRHHDLLKNQAKLEIHACGENGFKATEIMNLETGKMECTYKTKRAKESLRIIAVPYQVTLPTQEKASVYCFGLIDRHDKNTIEVDPRTFLQKYRTNSQSHAAPILY